MCKFIEIIESVNHGFDSASLPNSGFLCVTAGIINVNRFAHSCRHFRQSLFVENSVVSILMLTKCLF